MRIKKKAAWQPKHQGNCESVSQVYVNNLQIGCIESLTFDAEGKLIASLDQGGALIVSTVDTDELVTKTEFKKVGSCKIAILSIHLSNLPKTSVAFTLQMESHFRKHDNRSQTQSESANPF